MNPDHIIDIPLSEVYLASLALDTLLLSVFAPLLFNFISVLDTKGKDKLELFINVAYPRTYVAVLGAIIVVKLGIGLFFRPGIMEYHYSLVSPSILLLSLLVVSFCIVLWSIWIFGNVMLFSNILTWRLFYLLNALYYRFVLPHRQRKGFIRIPVDWIVSINQLLYWLLLNIAFKLSEKITPGDESERKRPRILILRALGEMLIEVSSWKDEEEFSYLQKEFADVIFDSKYPDGSIDGHTYKYLVHQPTERIIFDFAKEPGSTHIPADIGRLFVITIHSLTRGTITGDSNSKKMLKEIKP